MIMRSGGGAMTFAEAADRPFETILSGPVAGARAVAELARALGLRHAISADVGGTSFDTCLIDDGRPPVLYQGEVVGLPIQTPWIDVRSIGAGGGSIAYVDSGGLLRVGPQSAGADPGPRATTVAASEPTVTDAALVLGMIPAAQIAGDVPLVHDLAERALAPPGGAARLRLRDRGRLRRDPHRRRADGRCDPQRHDRARPRPARGGTRRLRRRRAAVRHRARRRARRQHRRDSALRRQLLGRRPAQRRSRSQRIANARHPSVGRGADGGRRPGGAAVRRARLAGLGRVAAEHPRRCTWTSASSVRSTP